MADSSVELKPVEPIKKDKKTKSDDSSSSKKKGKKSKKHSSPPSSADESSGSESPAARKTSTSKGKDGDVAHKREFVLSGESAKLQAKIMALLSKETPEKKLVCVQFFVNRIFKVDDVEQSTHVDLYLKLNWRSEKWVGKTDDEFQQDEEHLEKDWWRPGVEVTNAIELSKETEEDEAYWLEFPQYGILAYTQRYIGTIHSPMDLHQFPFDYQNIPITFESFHWKAADMQLVRLPSQAHQEPPGQGGSWITMGDDVNLVEWDVEGIDVDERVKHYAFEDRQYSQIYVTIKLRRRWGYYLTKVIAILVLIVMMSWSTCGMDPNELPDRTGTSVTLFLAAVAFNFVIGSSLPKISYNTRLDEYLLVSYLLITLSVLENVLAYQFYARIPNHGLALSFDKWSAVGLAGIFILYNIYFFFSVVYYELTKRIKPKPKSLSTMFVTDPDMLA